ncbi:MAG: FtsX-like permease family protein [Cytophagales bacterium]
MIQNLPKFISNKLRNASNTQFSGVVSRIAVVSVAFSAMVLLLSFSILEGFKSNIKNNIISFSSHIQISKFDINDNMDNVPISNQTKRVLYASPNIERIQEYAINTGIIKVGEEVHGVVFKGVGVDFNISTLQKNIVEGRFPEFTVSSKSNEVIISKLLQSKLNLKLGDNLIMYFITDSPKIRKLKIVGIFETGMTEFDDVFIIGDIQLVRDVNKWDKHTITGYEIFVKDFNQLKQTSDAVFDAMPNDMQMEVITDKYLQIFDWFKVLDWNVVILIVIIITVVGFNIVSTLVVMIMERTSMIGMLKAMGANNQLISKIFFYYGLSILSKGLIWGNLIAFILAFLQYHFKFIPLDPENYFMTSVPISWPILSFVFVNLIITFLVILALIVPIVFINKVKPIKAIKFN